MEDDEGFTQGQIMDHMPREFGLYSGGLEIEYGASHMWHTSCEASGASGLGRRGRHSGVQAHPFGCLGLWQGVAVLSGSVTLVHSDDPGTRLEKGISQAFAEGSKNYQSSLGLRCALVHLPASHVFPECFHSMLPLIHLTY